MRSLLEYLGVAWCRCFHSGSIAWAGGSVYTCRKCGKRYGVAWANRNALDPVDPDVFMLR
jgi:hypothetical protein